MSPETDHSLPPNASSGSVQPKGGEDFKVRVDQLFSQAVRRQAREDEATSVRLDAVRRELAKLKQELSVLRHTTEGSESSVKQAIDSQISNLAGQLAAISKGLERLPTSLAPAAAKIDHVVQRQAAGLAETRAEIAEALGRTEQQLREAFEAAMSDAKAVIHSAGKDLSGAVDKSRAEIEGRIEAMEVRLTADIEVAQEALFEQGGDAAEAAAEAARRMKSAIESGLGAAMSNAIRPFAREIRSLSERIAAAEAGFRESTDRLERFHRGLISYMQDRDTAMEQMRTRLLVELLSEAGEGLSRRQRTKLARGVAAAQVKIAGQAAQRPAAPGPEAPGSPRDSSDHEQGGLAPGGARSAFGAPPGFPGGPGPAASGVPPGFPGGPGPAASGAPPGFPGGPGPAASGAPPGFPGSEPGSVEDPRTASGSGWLSEQPLTENPWPSEDAGPASPSKVSIPQQEAPVTRRERQTSRPGKVPVSNRPDAARGFSRKSSVAGNANDPASRPAAPGTGRSAKSPPSGSAEAGKASSRKLPGSAVAGKGASRKIPGSAEAGKASSPKLPGSAVAGKAASRKIPGSAEAGKAASRQLPGSTDAAETSSGSIAAAPDTGTVAPPGGSAVSGQTVTVSSRSDDRGHHSDPTPAPSSGPVTPARGDPASWSDEQEFFRAWPTQISPKAGAAPEPTRGDFWGEEPDDSEEYVLVAPEFDPEGDSAPEADPMQTRVPRAVLKSSKPKGKKAGRGLIKAKASPAKRR